MDVNELRGYITLTTMLTFLGICWWAYRSRNRSRFEQDALLPFLDEPAPERTEARAEGGTREEQG